MLTRSTGYHPQNTSFGGLNFSFLGLIPASPAWRKSRLSLGSASFLKSKNGTCLLTHNGFYAILESDQEVISMRGNILKVKDEFKEVDTRTIDDRNRLTLGELMKGSKRVRLYKNDAGELLLQPVVEIPASEAWLFRNEQAMENVKAGLKDASEGKISKLNLKDL